MQEEKHHLKRNESSKLSDFLSRDARKDCPANVHKAQVVIIGAGLAGLAAAQRLHESGIDNVIILDALDRVGGRVHTINHSDYLLELGAQWLHGADDNPLYQWLTSLGMLNDFQDASLGFQGIYCTSSDKAEICHRLVKKVLDVVCESKLALSKDESYLDHLLADQLPAATENGKQKPRKFKNASQVFRCHLDMRMEQDDELAKNKQLVYAIFEWFLRYETIENCCDSMDEVSIQSYTDWTDLGDGTLLNFKEGYRSLLQWFCQHFPCEKWLHLNKQVVNIELLKTIKDDRGDPVPHWTDSKAGKHDSPLLVRYKCTTNGQESLAKTMIVTCDHVIVTCSLGFLKKNMRTFFTPELPPVKQELIKSIGFGTVNKIVLQFEQPFWPQSSGIKLIWRDSDFVGPDSFPIWCRDILSFDTVRRQPNLLIGWVGGHGAKTMELERDEEISRICLKILNKFLPEQHQRPTRLLSCICSRWHSNPFICGSYSFQSMDSLGMNVDKLQEPLYNHSEDQTNSHQAHHAPSLRSKNYQLSSSVNKIPRVLFAGEATAGKLYSTTHGAIISGWREADRLTDYLLASKQSRSVQSISEASNNLVLAPRFKMALS
jgi:spermine oxidase